MGQCLPCSPAPAWEVRWGAGWSVPAQCGGVRWPGCALAQHQPCSGSGCDTRWPAWQGWGCCRAASAPPAPSFLPGSRLFEYRGRVSPVPRVVPVKRPRVTIPLVRRVKATLPVKLFARSAAIANSSAKLKREYLHGVQQDGVETGVNMDLPSPGVHPWGQMLSGKNLKKNPKTSGNNSPSEGLSEANRLQTQQGKVQVQPKCAKSWCQPPQRAWTTGTQAFLGAYDHQQPPQLSLPMQ